MDHAEFDVAGDDGAERAVYRSADVVAGQRRGDVFEAVDVERLRAERLREHSEFVRLADEVEGKRSGPEAQTLVK